MPRPYNRLILKIQLNPPIKTNPLNLLTSTGLLVILNDGNGQVPVGLPVFKIGRRVALRAVVGSTPIHSRLLFNTLDSSTFC